MKPAFRRAVSIVSSQARRINYSLRSYAGEQAIEWPAVSYSPMPGLLEIHIAGCDEACEHVWGDELLQREQSGRHRLKWETGGNPAAKVEQAPASQGAYCQRCNGWRGALGLEPTIEMYIGHLILVMREMWRIMRPWAVAWINLGDSYAANRGYQVTDNKHIDVGNNHGSKVPNGLKPKDLMMIPARFALAAQADGWYLRSDIIWAKGLSFLPDYAGSCMPESVTDRPTKSHEYIFLLSKSEKYYFDMDAVRENHLTDPEDNKRITIHGRAHSGILGRKEDGHGGLVTNRHHSAGRNLRTVWAINPTPYPGAHFACWPQRLVEPMIKASTSAHGVCPTCGAPWRRCVERTTLRELAAGVDNENPKHKARQAMGLRSAKSGLFGSNSHNESTPQSPIVKTTGWAATCICGRDDVAPATVLDPFAGSGTTLRAAMKLGRNAIGVDISHEYLTDLVPERTSNIQMEMAL